MDGKYVRVCRRGVHLFAGTATYFEDKFEFLTFGERQRRRIAFYSRVRVGITHVIVIVKIKS